MLTPEVQAGFTERRALHGQATPGDIAAAIVFLASADARFITGAVLPIDGGITAGTGQPRFRPHRAVSRRPPGSPIGPAIQPLGG